MISKIVVSVVYKFVKQTTGNKVIN